MTPNTTPTITFAPPAIAHPADSDGPLIDVVRLRWSARAYDPTRPVTPAQQHALLEAARWAPSSGNSLAWRVAVVDQAADADGFARALDVKDGNRRWAQHAPLLLFTFLTDPARATAGYDLGLAMANLTVQATAMGLSLRTMGGILHDEVRRIFQVPEGVQPMTAIAVGYAAPAHTLPDDLAAREQAPRTRRPLADLAFTGGWDGAWGTSQA